MNRRIYCMVVALILALILTVSAQAWARNTGVSFNGTLMSELTGACSNLSTDYDFYCPSANCVCDQYVGTLSGGLVGRDKNAHLALTIDQGAKTPSSVFTNGCMPFFGVMTFSTSRETETDNVTGTVCSSFNNPSKFTVAGGVGVATSSYGVSGSWGTMSGAVDKTKKTPTVRISANVKLNL